MRLGLDLQFDDATIEGWVLRPGLKQPELNDALAGVDDLVWQEEFDVGMSAAELYNLWVARLNRWLGLPANRVGYSKRLRRVDHCNARAPVRVRAHWKSNIARKVQAHWTELQAIVDWQNLEEHISVRAVSLVRALARSPWAEWGVENPFHEAVRIGKLRALRGRDMVNASDWMRVHWEQVHSDIVLTSMHALKLWRMDIKDSIAQGRMKRPGRWLKGYGTLPVIRTSDELLTHPQAVGKALVDAWTPIFSPDNYSSMSEEAVKHMVSHAKPYAYCPGPLQPDQLSEMVRAKPITACGPDSIALAMLQKLPLRAWDMVCAVLNKCEEGDDWPEQLCEVALTAIPKAGEQTEATALKVRLISLTSHVYRAWSSLRASQLSGWLSRVVGPGVYGGVRGKSARMASVLDAMRWEESAVDANPLFAVYLDFSKCFDTIGVADVVGCACELGLSPRVATALKGWYRQHSRSITISGWVQAPIFPKKGIMQGCGLSVVLCAVWGATWSSWVTKLMEDRLRCSWHSTVYMDDYSFSAMQMQDVQMILGLTRRHCQLWGVQLNERKSSILANQLGKSQLDGAQIELAKDETYKLLGIETGWTANGIYIYIYEGKTAGCISYGQATPGDSTTAISV